jgi:2-oxoglutarate ferredoxin oxidoreductase subunit alpha
MLRDKYKLIEQNEVRYEACNLDGDYRLLLVSFGTMSRVCRTAIEVLKAAGIEVGMLRPKSLWPFPLKAIRDAASKKSCVGVASIEMNMGQMLEDVERSVQGRCPVKWFGKAGGDIPTPEHVADFLKRMLD